MLDHLLHGFVGLQDRTQMAKCLPAHEPDAYSALQVGQTNAQEAVTCRRARITLFRRAPFHRPRLLYVRRQYGTIPWGANNAQLDETRYTRRCQLGSVSGCLWCRLGPPKSLRTHGQTAVPESTRPRSAEIGGAVQASGTIEGPAKTGVRATSRRSPPRWREPI
jgi:hypothetical protein